MSGQRKKEKKREPELEPILNNPVWWHIHGRKMVLRKLDTAMRTLTVANTAAEVRITLKLPDEYVARFGLRWVVEWRVQQSLESGSSGSTTWTSREFAAAFGLIDEVSHSSDWLIDRYGGDAAAQFGFIRWEQFLNIPCPGTGHDGDPNVSIELDNILIAAAEELLRSVQADKALFTNSRKLFLKGGRRVVRT